MTEYEKISPFPILQCNIDSSNFKLTFLAPCISESCNEININLNFYLHTSLWCPIPDEAKKLS